MTNAHAIRGSGYPRCMRWRCASVAAVAFVVAGLGGCQSHAYSIGAETSSQQFVDDASSQLLVPGDPVRMSVLPASGANGLQGYSPAANDALDDALLSVERRECIVPYPAVISRLAAGNHATAWNAAATQLQSSGTVDAKSLETLGTSLSTRYLLIPGIASITAHTDDRVDIFGVTLVRSRWGTVHASLQVWDTEQKAIVWQSSGSCTLYTEVFLAQPVSVRNTLKELFETMLLDLIHGRSRSVVSRDVTSPQHADPAKR